MFGMRALNRAVADVTRGTPQPCRVGSTFANIILQKSFSYYRDAAQSCIGKEDCCCVVLLLTIKWSEFFDCSVCFHLAWACLLPSGSETCSQVTFFLFQRKQKLFRKFSFLVSDLLRNSFLWCLSMCGCPPVVQYFGHSHIVFNLPQTGKDKVWPFLKVCLCAQLKECPDVLKNKRPGAIKSYMRTNTSFNKRGEYFLSWTLSFIVMWNEN